MITKCKRPVFREVDVQVSGRNLVIGIYPHGWITVRLKGTQRLVEANARWLYNNRTGIARHQARQARRRMRKERAIEIQNQMMADAIAAEGDFR